MITQNAVPKALTQQEIKEATGNDTIVLKVIENNKTNKWTNDPQLQPHFKIRNLLSAKNNLSQRKLDSYTIDTTTTYSKYSTCVTPSRN